MGTLEGNCCDVFKIIERDSSTFRGKEVSMLYVCYKFRAVVVEFNICECAFFKLFIV